MLINLIVLGRCGAIRITTVKIDKDASRNFRELIQEQVEQANLVGK